MAEGRRQRAVEIAGIAVIARNRRNRETKPLTTKDTKERKGKPLKSTSIWMEERGDRVFLKVLLQLHKLLHLQQLQPLWRWIHGLMLQRPGEIVRHKDGVDTGGQRGIDI